MRYQNIDNMTNQQKTKVNIYKTNQKIEQINPMNIDNEEYTFQESSDKNEKILN